MNARPMAISAFLVFGLGVLAGQQLTRGELAELRRQVGEDQRLAASAATRRLDDAQTRGDALTLQLAGQAQQIETLTKERRDALKNTTSGRACLGSASLRLLDGAPGLRVAGLPKATGGLAAAGARVATHPDDWTEGRWASDSDLGQWALEAGAQHKLCRQRLDALIEWHQPSSTTSTATP